MRSGAVFAIFTLLCTLAFIGCGDPDGGTTPTVTNVTISPDSPSIAKGETQKFTAVVDGLNSPAQTVTWSVTGGTKTATAFSGATLTVAADETATSLTVTATSKVDDTKFGTTTVTVVDADATTVTLVTVSPPTISIAQGKTQEFTAEVDGSNSPPQTVTWSVMGSTKPATAFSGAILTVADDETATSLIVTATSEFNSSKFGTAKVTVTVPPPVVHFVAAGYFASNTLVPYGFATSSDGATWTLQTSSFGTSLIRGVAHGKDAAGNGIWVAVGGGSDIPGSSDKGGKIATSGDGVTWTQRTHSFGSTPDDGINGVAYGNGLWVAVGNSGKIATSNNGTNWGVHATSFDSTDVNSVAYGKDASGKGLWVAVGGNGKLATSNDGVTWAQQTSSFGQASNFNTAGSINGVVYGKDKNGDGLWVAVGSSGSMFNPISKLAISWDGITWAQQSNSFSSDYSDHISSVAYGKDKNGDGLWVAVGTSGELATSSDGITWTPQTSGFDIPSTQSYTTSINGVAYGEDSSGNGFWVAGGLSSIDPQLATSRDGEEWAQRKSALGNNLMGGIQAVATDFEP